MTCEALIKAGIVPHKDKTTVLCFDLSDTSRTLDAIRRISRKYPLPFMLAMDVPTYGVLYDLSATEMFFAMQHSYRPINACLDIYNVVGVLCGSDRAFPDLDRRVMRC